MFFFCNFWTTEETLEESQEQIQNEPWMNFLKIFRGEFYEKKNGTSLEEITWSNSIKKILKVLRGPGFIYLFFFEEMPEDTLEGIHRGITKRITEGILRKSPG